MMGLVSVCLAVLLAKFCVVVVPSVLVPLLISETGRDDWVKDQVVPADDDSHGDKPVPVAVEVGETGYRLHGVDREDAEDGQQNQDGGVVPVVVAVDLLADQNRIPLVLLPLLLICQLVVLFDLLEHALRLELVNLLEEDVAEDVGEGE